MADIKQRFIIIDGKDVTVIVINIIRCRSPPSVFDFTRISQKSKMEENQMVKIKACYIKDGQAYIEKDLSELNIIGTKVLEYPNRRFFYFGDILLEVSPEQYRNLHKDKDRAKYVRKREREVEIVSLDNIIAEDLNGHGILPDTTDHEELAIRKLMGEMAMELLRKLPSDEYELIMNVVINKVSERTYAAEKGLPQKTVNNRKRKILAGLRKNLGEKD
ncbi:MAG: hypothetical protein FWE74_06995 [Oscillospiraceae bacterium]|nr:hypothetical protein [Oscillospiraceae bacterium]